MPVNPGRLRERVTILRGKDENTPGGATTKWELAGTVWASVAQVGASGLGKYQQAGFTDITHEIILRASPLGDELTLGRTRFLWNGRMLQPVTPTNSNDHRGRFVSLGCREVNDGETQNDSQGCQ